MIKIDNYPQLKLIAWNRHTKDITEEEALSLYETNWRFVDQDNLTSDEQKLINRLIYEYGKGFLHV